VSVSRTLQSGLDTTNLIAFPPVPVSACKSGVTSVVPDNDIMVCDAASGHLGQFETAMMAQNYAMLSMRPRQKFDFTGRTGIITSMSTRLRRVKARGGLLSMSLTGP
jgi:hypothetical protein